MEKGRTLKDEFMWRRGGKTLSDEVLHIQMLLFWVNLMVDKSNQTVSTFTHNKYTVLFKKA